MKNGLFYETRTLKKFRIVFETEEMIVGADRKNKHRTFRKDIGAIAFSRREALEMRLLDLSGHSQIINRQLKSDENSALAFNFSEFLNPAVN